MGRQEPRTTVPWSTIVPEDGACCSIGVWSIIACKYSGIKSIVLQQFAAATNEHCNHQRATARYKRTHFRTCTTSPTRTMPTPRGTALQPKHAPLGTSGESPRRVCISGLNGTAASRTPVVGSTLGSYSVEEVQCQGCARNESNARDSACIWTRPRWRAQTGPRGQRSQGG